MMTSLESGQFPNSPKASCANDRDISDYITLIKHNYIAQWESLLAK